MLKIWEKVLTDKGLLIIDTATAELPPFSGIGRHEGGIVEILEEKREGKTRKVHFRFFRDEGRKMELIGELKRELIFYTVEEMVEMLEAAGFDVLYVFDRYSFRPLKEKGTGATYVALKRT